MKISKRKKNMRIAFYGRPPAIAIRLDHFMEIKAMIAKGQIILPPCVS